MNLIVANFEGAHVYTCSGNTSSNLVCCMFLMIKAFGSFDGVFWAGAILAACNHKQKLIT